VRELTGDMNLSKQEI
jgi:replicative superfamily II helicase